jgi:membrane protease YdiL (CAAX protease family)
MTIALAAFLVSLAVSSLVLRRKGDRPMRRLLQMAGPLLPVSGAERGLFAAVAVGAGIAEELAFRGFLLFYFATFLPGLGVLVAVLASSAAFGLGHLYQGVRGVALTAAIGLFMAALYVLSGSLLAPMVVHAALDLRLLVIATPERLRRLSASTEPRA